MLSDDQFGNPSRTATQVLTTLWILDTLEFSSGRDYLNRIEMLNEEEFLAHIVELLQLILQGP